MRYTILHILCEGQTEERFVKEVLSPYFQQFNVYPKPILLLTSKKNNARGGMLSYSQTKRDLGILIKRFRDSEGEKHLFTTMFDFYALPDDFPGYKESIGVPEIRQRIAMIEHEFACDISNESFIPYLQLHEFETLLFSDISQLKIDYPLSSVNIDKLKVETDVYGDPEMINDSPSTAPSKRIIKALEKNYNYNKVQSGTRVATRIGIQSLLSHCRHFSEWINRCLNATCL